MYKKKFIVATLSSALLLTAVAITPILAAETHAPAMQESFHLKPVDTAEKARLQKAEEEHRQEKIEAWTVDLNGKKTKVPPFSKDGVGAQFTSGGYTYVWDSYVQNYKSYDTKRFFVSSVALENYTSVPIAMKYTQQDTVTKQWTTTGKVDVETGFRAAVLASAKLAVGLSVTSSDTTTANTTVEYTFTLNPMKKGEISKYKAGQYSSGAGAWKQYTSNNSFIGMYYETGSAWTIVPSRVTYVAREYSL